MNYTALKSIAFYVIPALVFMHSSEVCAKKASVTVYTDAMSEWTVDRMLFGRFFEHHGCDVYPGIYEQYIVNPSFEAYYRKGDTSPTPQRDRKPWLVFPTVQETQGIAYPWEPYNSEKAIYEVCPDSFNSDLSQRIIGVAANDLNYVGIKQRLALPDYRTGKYTLRFYAKSPKNGQTIRVILEEPQKEKTFDSQEIKLSGEWTLYTVHLDMGTQRASARHADRHGIYDLIVTFQGEGDVTLDQMTLFPADAVEGVWNPETIENLKRAGVTVIRWPGGNFASGYHWQDGIGPIEKRVTRPNLAWEGLESNHAGTNEFLRFCELAGLTPLICVGFDTCTVQEAANWVEYCNGSVSTPFGKLRAQQGHPQPYNVKLWQVGNEVYGSYQIGHTNAEDYALRYLDYYQAMKKADPNISIMAMGRDPGYHTDDENAWNKTLFRIIGDKMDYLDIHRYVRGIRKEEDLKTWEISHLAEIYISYPSQYDVIINSIRQIAKDMDLQDVRLAVTEWGQYLTLPHKGLPHAFSHANAVFYAGMMNCFIRNSDFVKISCSHDFSVFVSNEIPWNIPVLPRSEIAKLYAEIRADRVLKTEVTCDTFDLNRKITQMIELDGIPYLDVVALAREDKTQIALFIVNRSLNSDYDIVIDLDGMSNEYKVQTLTFSAKADPMAPQSWANPQVSKIDNKDITIGVGAFEIFSPSCSVVRVIINNRLCLDEKVKH